MASIQEKIRAQLAAAIEELAAAKAKVERCEWEVSFCRKLLEGADDASDAQPSSGNGQQQRMFVVPSVTPTVPTAGLGNTAHQIVAVMQQVGTPLSIPAIVDRIITSGAATESDELKLRNNVSSVMYRAIKNLQHPVFRRSAKKGEFELVASAS